LFSPINKRLVTSACFYFGWLLFWILSLVCPKTWRIFFNLLVILSSMHYYRSSKYLNNYAVEKTKWTNKRNINKTEIETKKETKTKLKLKHNRIKNKETKKNSSMEKQLRRWKKQKPTKQTYKQYINRNNSEIETI
jgi:hypothetical protein